MGGARFLFLEHGLEGAGQVFHVGRLPERALAAVQYGGQVVGPLALADPMGAMSLSLRGYATIAYQSHQCRQRAERKREGCWDDCDAAVGLQVVQ